MLRCRRLGHLLFCAMLASCALRRDHSNPLAVTNRPDVSHFPTIIQLDNEPTLARTRSPDELTRTLAKVAKEQDDAIRKLQAISPGAQVIYRYRHVLNGLYVFIPTENHQVFNAAFGPKSKTPAKYRRPRVISDQGAPTAVATGNFERNSVKFIGVPGGPRGQGIRVGVIDTGIDYTHKMFGGAGSPDAYKNNDPKTLMAGAFPTAKIVGGIDLVGGEYDPVSVDIAKFIPKPGPNPLDLQGHGTHVAGTIAGTGDGEATYDGVAKDAKLYAIKIFAKAATDDGVIVAALDYAANPSQDGNPADRLDVVNLSLGGSFGVPGSFTETAIDTLTQAGTAVAVAAGNDGDVPFVLGSPAAADHSIAVAAVSDDSDQIWRFPQVQFNTAGSTPVNAEMVEAFRAVPWVSPPGVIEAPGFYQDSNAAIDAASLAGKIVLSEFPADRSTDSAYFGKLAAAGAKGLVLISDDATSVDWTFVEVDIQIPIVATEHDAGKAAALTMQSSPTNIRLNIPEKKEKPELIGRIASFSSRGPRSIDAHLKPEVTAPGVQVISAKMGSGSGGMEDSGTSMATPHVAGAFAILKQKYPKLSIEALKSLLVSSAKILTDATGKAYPLSRQGAGMVEVGDALAAPIAIEPATLSFGVIQEGEQRTLGQTSVRLTNLTSSSATLNISSVDLLTIEPSQLTLGPNESKNIQVTPDMSRWFSAPGDAELEDRIWITTNGVRQQIPFFGIARRNSKVSGVKSGGQLVISNGSANPGKVLALNLLKGQTAKAEDGNPCSIQVAGYRIDQGYLYLGVGLASALTNWNICEISLLIDLDGDGIADKELLGTDLATLQPMWSAVYNTFGTILTDAAKMRTLAKTYSTQAEPSLDFTSAIVDKWDYEQFPFAGIAVLKAPMSALVDKAQSARFKLLSINTTADVRYGDEYFSGPETEWKPFSMFGEEATIAGPIESPIAPNERKQFDAQSDGKGNSSVLFFPNNLVESRWQVVN